MSMLNEQEKIKLEELKALKEKEGSHFHPSYEQELQVLMSKENLNTPAVEEEMNQAETSQEGETEGVESNGQEENGEQIATEENSGTEETSSETNQESN